MCFTEKTLCCKNWLNKRKKIPSHYDVLMVWDIASLHCHSASHLVCLTICSHNTADEYDIWVKRNINLTLHNFKYVGFENKWDCQRTNISKHYTYKHLVFKRRNGTFYFERLTLVITTYNHVTSTRELWFEHSQTIKDCELFPIQYYQTTWF